MALIALRDIRCIDYLAYGTIFTRAMFLPKKKGDVFFPARKAADERWGVVAPTTHHNHHDEVRKNGIRYALGLTRSIAYRRNCLVNRNPDIVVEMTLHVGIK
jgi:hypothetical protein